MARCFHLNGFDCSSLLSYLSKPIKQLPQVERVSNQLILELLTFKDQHSQCNFKVLYAWLMDLYGEAWPHESPSTVKAITRSVCRLMKIYQKLDKAKSFEGEEISEFLQQEFVLPKLGIFKGQVVHFSPIKKSQLQGAARDDAKLTEVRKKCMQLTEMPIKGLNVGKLLLLNEEIVLQASRS